MLPRLIKHALLVAIGILLFVLGAIYGGIPKSVEEATPKAARLPHETGTLFSEQEIGDIVKVLEDSRCRAAQGCHEGSYTLYPVDIDGDGQSEYVVETTGGYCGGGGCSAALFMKRAGRWQNLAEVFGSINALSSQTNGMRDVALEYKRYLPQGGFDTKSVTFTWNGQWYGVESATPGQQVPKVASESEQGHAVPRNVETRQIDRANGPGTYTNGKKMACIAADDFDAVIDASVNEQWSAVDRLVQQNRCFIMARGLRASILESKGFLWSKKRVRVFLPGGDTVTVWTFTEELDLR